jgi:hypothetical protein
LVEGGNVVYFLAHLQQEISWFDGLVPFSAALEEEPIVDGDVENR